jgi:hypothetical protein
MNYDEHPNDSALARELRDSLSALAAPERPPLAAITSRGRAHQRRRLAGFAGLGVTGVAAGTALALSLTGVLGAAPARITGTIRTADFTLTSYANGTDALRLSTTVLLDPSALQHALAQDGIPALVKTDMFCSSTPELRVKGVVTAQQPNGRPVKGRPGAGTVTVINPAAIPAGTELFIGYFNSDNTVAASLIDTSSYTCTNATQPPATP